MQATGSVSGAQEADQRTQQHLQKLATSIAELTASNMEMCSRERLMTELVQTQESFIDRISSDQVCLLTAACVPAQTKASQLIVGRSSRLPSYGTWFAGHEAAFSSHGVPGHLRPVMTPAFFFAEGPDRPAGHASL